MINLHDVVTKEGFGTYERKEEDMKLAKRVATALLEDLEKDAAKMEDCWRRLSIELENFAKVCGEEEVPLNLKHQCQYWAEASNHYKTIFRKRIEQLC
nr:hypothetical protein 5 [Candidatus Omnitrophota bacterium]